MESVPGKVTAMMASGTHVAAVGGGVVSFFTAATRQLVFQEECGDVRGICTAVGSIWIASSPSDGKAAAHKKATSVLTAYGELEDEFKSLFEVKLHLTATVVAVKETKHSKRTLLWVGSTSGEVALVKAKKKKVAGIFSVTDSPIVKIQCLASAEHPDQERAWVFTDRGDILVCVFDNNVFRCEGVIPPHFSFSSIAAVHVVEVSFFGMALVSAKQHDKQVFVWVASTSGQVLLWDADEHQPVQEFVIDTRPALVASAKSKVYAVTFAGTVFAWEPVE